MSDLVNVFGPMDGAEIHGGCEQCDAYQMVRVVDRAVFSVDVFHDNDCPVLKRIEERRDI